ncbi:MAG TPA: 4Fe-4S binding protein [Thermodesulfobacteriota bacterium]|nr:4Fe-4S binding protein [Thermodesulfobacteriota bacterium]
MNERVEEVYKKLAKHLSSLGMGYPEKEELIEILRENFTSLEAEVALAIPTKVIPFELCPVEEIARRINLPREELKKILSNLAHRGLLFSRRMKGGEDGFALQQFGYGFPQTFFWGGLQTPNSQKMAELVVRYSKRDQLYEAYGKTETKPLRYVPASLSVDPDEHAVFPFEMMEQLVQKVHVIALVHCPCRATAQLIGKKKCDHPLENCIKYDELAEYLIEKGIGKEITKQEAVEVTRRSEEAGLVHLVDNARERIKHTCNCCGCCCWSVGTIRRKRIPRDVLMATYFLRETDKERCTGRGRCVEICPVDVIRMEGDFPVVDSEWCIGCGVCAIPCPASAIRLVRKSDAVPPRDFKALHRQILKERRFES